MLLPCLHWAIARRGSVGWFSPASPFKAFIRSGGPYLPYRRYGFWLCLAAVLCAGLSGAGEGPSITPDQAARDAVPVDAVKLHVARLAGMGSRIPGMPGHRQARDYVVEQLRAMGYSSALAGPGQDDDVLGAQALTADAESPEGQTFAALRVPAGQVAPPFNVRFTLLDPDDSFQQGEVLVEGVGVSGSPLTEVVKLNKSLNKRSVAAGDRPFGAVTKLTLRNSVGITTGDTLAAGYDSRFALGAQRFWGTAPHDAGNGKLTFEQPSAVGTATTYPLYSIWPNGAALTVTGAQGLQGQVVFAGTGEAHEFDGLPMKERPIVVLELPAGTEGVGVRWTFAASLGAQAVIVIEPETALRPQLEKLFVAAPVEFPRFWIPRKEGQVLKAALTAARASSAFPKARATITTQWTSDIWENLFLLIPGSGNIKGQVSAPDKLLEKLNALSPSAALERAQQAVGDARGGFLELRDALTALKTELHAAGHSTKLLQAPLKEVEAELASTVILASYYDSCSVVPALAPGAEQALGCATLLELARRYRTEPPPRDTLVLFCTAHFQGLKGEREFFGLVEKLPDESTAGALASRLGEGTIHAEALRKLVQVGPILPNLTREKLGDHVAVAATQFESTKLHQDINELLAQENAAKSGVSVGGALVGILFLLIAVMMFTKTEIKRNTPTSKIVLSALLATFLYGGVPWLVKALFSSDLPPLYIYSTGSLTVMAVIMLLSKAVRNAALQVVCGSLAGFAALVALVFWVLVPYIHQNFASGEKVVDVAVRRDGLLDVWKEDTASRESDLEQRIRSLRAEQHLDKLEGAEEDRDRARSAALDALAAERKSYEIIGRHLYTLSTAGASLVPVTEGLLEARVAQSAASVLQRLDAENEWMRRELERRNANRVIHELAEARLSRKAETDTGRKTIFLSLDMSAGFAGTALFYKGKLYRPPGDLDARYKGFWGRMVLPIVRSVEQAVGVPTGVHVPDTLLENQEGQKGRRANTFLGTDMAMACEVSVQAQNRGLTFATPYDLRMAWDTPQDSLALLDESDLPAPERRKWKNVEMQLRLIGPLLRHIMAEAAVTQQSRFEEKLRLTSLSQIIFKSVRRGGSRSIFPTIPLPDTLVQQCVEQRTASGVRLGLYEAANPLGEARIIGVQRGVAGNWDIARPDPVTGEVTYALNKPARALGENSALAVTPGVKSRTERVELFRAQGVSILDLVDPRYLVPLTRCTILAGQTESRPQAFGTSYPYKLEPHRVLYAEPGTRIKCLFREGQFGVRLALLGVEPKTVSKLLDQAHEGHVDARAARGPGFALGSQKVLTWLPRRAAVDLYCLSEHRLSELRAHSICNAKLDNPDFPGTTSSGTVSVVQGSSTVTGQDVAWSAKVVRNSFRVLGTLETYVVEDFAPGKLVLDRPYVGPSGTSHKFLLTGEDPGLHNLARLRMDEAIQAEDAGHYGLAWHHYIETWGLESRAYPEVLGTANDSVLGVVFYLFLLLPFCYFTERLLITAKFIEHQLAWFFGCFVSMFGLLWWVHPAFSLVAAPPIILLAFVILSLTVIVVVIVYGKFNTAMRLLQQGVQGVQSADVNRASAGLVAVTLGISQMRRRILRTALTCLTVVLLTFTALSFTSMVPSLAQPSIDLSPGSEKDAPYEGVLLRQLNFDTLRPETYEQFRHKLEGLGLRAAPRFWKVAKQDQKLYIDVLNAEGKLVSPSSLLGVSETELTLFERGGKLRKALLAGAWVRDDERDACVLPAPLAKSLRPSSLSADAWSPAASVGQRVHLGSYLVTIKGVFDPDVLNSEVRDLDNEPITPVDFTASSAARGAGAKENADVGVEGVQQAGDLHYAHVDAATTLIVPWNLAVLLGADLRSVAVRVDSPETLKHLVTSTLSRVQKNLFVAEAGRRKLYATTSKMSLAGLGNLVVPLLISVLILLNVMIGAVYERGREITIFSALGLAPSHIAALFLAEALVYATLGAILGYLLGQGTAKVVQLLDIGGLYLNYSSSSAVFVTAIVMAAVVLSTLYPALLAARAAAPSEDRRWGVPDPVGDEISLELPFSFQRDLVPGASLFLHEFFNSHAESSLGKFTAKEVTLEAFHTEHGEGLCLFFIAWLAPYDLGVSQEVQIYIVPTKDGLYLTEASFFRISGYVASWQRVNLPFLNTLRKQLLIWRTLSPQQRQAYAVRGYYQFQEAFEAVGWPAPEGVVLPTREELDPTTNEEENEMGTAPVPA